MDQQLQEYLEELIAFNPTIESEEAREAIIRKGKALVERKLDPKPQTLEDIIERRKLGVNTESIVIPVHVKSEIDMHLNNVDRILAVQKMTQEKYIAAAGTVAKTIVSLIKFLA